MITFKKAKSEIFAICLIKAIPMQKPDTANLINSQLKIWFKDFEKHNLIFTENQFIEALNKMADSEVFYNNMLPSLDIFKKYLKAKTLEEIKTSLELSKKTFIKITENLIYKHTVLHKNQPWVLENELNNRGDFDEIQDIEKYFNNGKKIELEKLRNLFKKMQKERFNDYSSFIDKLEEKFNEVHKSEIEFLESSKIIKIDDNAQERKFKNMMQLN